MISSIYADPVCFGITRGVMEEEGIAIEFCEELKRNGDIDCNKVAILKPDAFYNTVDFARPPRSVDGIVVVDCGEGVFFYVAELKSSRSKGINRTEIQQKFDTVFNNFLANDFAHIFQIPDYNLKDIRLWLVCDPLQIRRRSSGDADYLEKIKRIADRQRSMLAEMGTGYRPYTFKGIKAVIQPILSPPKILTNGFQDLLA